MFRHWFSSLLFVFCLCFASFVLGWFVAVNGIPGNLVQEKRAQQEGKEGDSFFKKKKQKLVSSGKQKLVSSEKQKLVSSEKQKLVSSEKQKLVSSEKQKLVSSEKQKLVSSEKQKLVSSGKSTQLDKTKKKSSFLDKIRENILFLFDPYKMSSFFNKDSLLEKDNAYIRRNTEKDLKTLIKEKRALNKEKARLASLKPKKSDPPLEHPFRQIKASEQRKKQDETLQKLQKEYDKKNYKQFLTMPKNQIFFQKEGKYSFLVNVFSEKEKALDYMKGMKNKYPFWSFLIKAHPNHIRIYLGPFQSKQKALEFKEILPFPFPFSQAFLEEVSL